MPSFVLEQLSPRASRLAAFSYPLLVPEAIPIIDLGRLAYAAAYQIQLTQHAEVLASRDSANPEVARILLVEHDPPAITISRRADARKHLLATDAMLGAAGVQLAETDRGGDITYHGPGQLVAYPIVDLNALRLGLHDYMRLLEAAVIETCADFGIAAGRDAGATGVWVCTIDPRATRLVQRPDVPAASTDLAEPGSVARLPPRKICAMGVRVRRWIAFHGLALNVTSNLDHFKLIVPCGLAGREVTSLHRELGAACPSMEAVKVSLCKRLTERLAAAATNAHRARAS